MATTPRTPEPREPQEPDGTDRPAEPRRPIEPAETDQGSAPWRRPEPRPLSERERRTLGELEGRLVDEDPRLLLRMGPRRGMLLGRVSPRLFNGVIQGAVIFVVAVVLLPAAWSAALITAALLFVPTFLVVLLYAGTVGAAGRAKPEAEPGPGPGGKPES